MATTVTTPQTHAKLLSAEHRIASATLRQELLMILADAVSIRRLLMFVGDVSGLGTATYRQLYAQMGAGIPMEGASETGTLTAIGVDVDYRDITLGRHGLEAHETFLAQITQRQGVDWSISDLARNIAATFEAEFMDSLATLIATFSNGVGSTGVDASMDDMYDLTYEFDLQDGVNGPLLGLFHGRQIADLKESKRGEPADWIKDESQVAFKAPGYQGELLGVSMFKSNRVTSDGTDRWGAAWTPRAIAYTIAQSGISNIRGLSQWAVLIQELGLILDWASDSNGALSKFFANTHYGMSIGTQGQLEGRYFQTDA